MCSSIRAVSSSCVAAVLGAAPTQGSKATIERLCQPAPTQFRLRGGEFRAFYDVDDRVVLIVQILSKEDSLRYLGESS